MGYTHGTKWSDELIREKVIEVVNGLSLDRMPSKKECDDYFGNNSLSNAVSRRCGWYKLANELNLTIKDSETFFGKSFETVAAETLQSIGFEVRRMSQNFPYDILVDDCVKIDVKASRLYRGKLGNFYSFNLEKPFATCDFFLLFKVGEHNDITGMLVVPSNLVISQNQISVGEAKSKYNRFTDRFDLIRSMVEFYDSLAV